MGSSTAWHLANQGESVRLLEMQDSVYTSGSSYGEARIARSSNRGNDMWSYLHNYSVAETQLLIDYLNSQEDGSPFKMEDIYTTSPVTYVGVSAIHDRLLSSLIRQEVDYDMATNPREGKSKFEVVLPDSVLIQREYNKHSGMVNPRKLIACLHEAIKKKGSKISYGTRVTDLRYNKNTDVYEITAENGTGETEVLKAHQIISAAGPHSGELLRNIAPVFEELINPQRVFLAFLRINADKYNSLSGEEKEKLSSFYPVINSHKGTREGSFFSMIEYYDENNLPIFKIGGHFQRSPIANLDGVWEQEVSPDEIAWSMKSTAGYFKMLSLPIEEEDLDVVDGYSCVYSLTETEVPLVTPILNESGEPDHDCIVLGGMSGVGAKGAMTYGLIAANLMTDHSPIDSTYLSTARSLGVERLME